MKPWLATVLAATLLASAGLAWWPDTPAADAAAGLLPPPRAAALRQTDLPAARRPVPAGAPSNTSASAQQPPALPTRPADWPEPTPDALAAWQGPTAAPARPATAAGAQPPTAPVQTAGPAFPYRWIGQLDDGGAPQVLLASAQRSVGVRLGATLDGRWRLLLGPGGVLQAQALPDGVPQAVPGAPPAAPPTLSP
jgi:hypothetical protein